MKKREFIKLSTIAVTGLAFSPFYACNPTPQEGGPGVATAIFSCGGIRTEYR
jgi:hypothetical protein